MDFFIWWWGGEFLVKTHTTARFRKTFPVRQVKLWHEKVSIASLERKNVRSFSVLQKTMTYVNAIHFFCIVAQSICSVDECENPCKPTGQFIFSRHTDYVMSLLCPEKVRQTEKSYVKSWANHVPTRSGNERFIVSFVLYPQRLIVVNDAMICRLATTTSCRSKHVIFSSE